MNRIGAARALAWLAWAWFAWAWFAWVGLAGCSLTPKLVGVKPVTLEEGRRDVDTCALNGDRLSALTHEVLALHDLERNLSKDPMGTLRALHAGALERPGRPALFALAETSYWLGKRRNDRACHLAAAVYAYLYLFSEDGLPDPFDRRFRWAVDLYNQGLLRAGTSKETDRFALAEGEHALPVGKLRIALDSSALASAASITGFLPADGYRIHGLKLRLRDSGLGVALIGLGDPDVVEQERAERIRNASHRALPATAFLRLQPVADGLAALADGLDATLELHSGYDAETVDVLGTRVPLETDRSTVLAHALDDPAVWRFSLRGLFGSADAGENHLILVQPYQRGRMPVVFVHGTASSPAYWADLFNSLWWDPELRDGVQFWFYQYATGNPLVHSAADLRETLAEALATLDPEGTDPALQEMVVVGHSQGGLLAHLLVVDGDLDWLEEISGQSVESFGFEPEERTQIERYLEFDPLPFVSRVVYISTPHRGSFLAKRWYSSLFAGLIDLPKNVTSVGSRFLAKLDPSRVPIQGVTSLEGMNPDNPMLARLARAPTAARVTSHSIISIGSADAHDPEAVARSDDGVVEYASAHLEGTASEDLVASGHSCQSHPATIEAVHRILLEHVRALRE